MISKYPGRCPECGIRFITGITVITKRNGKWVHEICPSSQLSIDEKKEIEYQSAHGVCKCGHEKNSHSRFIGGIFVGCQLCRCNRFERKNKPLPIVDYPIHGSKMVDSLIDFDKLADALSAPVEEAPEPKKEFKPSKYQQAIFDFISNGSGNAVVEAVAGSGKTTTIVKALDLTPTTDKVAFIAFNKHIVKELEKRSPSHVKVSTLHALGLNNIKRNNPNVKIDSKGEKLDEILNKIYPVSRQAVEEGLITKEQKKENYLKRAAMRKLVAIAKNTLVDVLDGNSVLEVIDRYNIEIDENHIDEIVSKLPEVMDSCKANEETVDFDDMVWFPLVTNMPLEKFDWLFVDEWQDMNISNIEFLMRSLSSKGRMIVVGDKQQSLYAFRGATPEAMDIAISRLNATVLPLSVTYRCPASHVRLAKQIVPQLEARDNAPEGLIVEMDEFNLVAELKPGDMVICRTNAPLIQPAFECVRQGKKAIIRSDIEKQLLDLINRFETDNLAEFQVSLTEYYNQEYQKKMDLGKEMQAELLTDRYETINFIIQEGGRIRTVFDLKRKIKDLFSDDVEGIVFSSVHKAKGLEAERVFILRPDLMPHKRAKKDFELAQEMNCKYVAETRSKSDLYFVNGGG